MRNKVLFFTLIFTILFTVNTLTQSATLNQKPKLDCNAMVSKAIKAFQEKDVITLCKLNGMEYNEQTEAEFKQQMKALEENGMFYFILEQLKLFPKIGEIPDWISDVLFEFNYLTGNSEIEFEVQFTFKDGTWLITQLAPDLREELQEERKATILGYSSPLPPEGQKTIDAGINEILNRLISDIKNKDWDSISKYSNVNIIEIDDYPEKFIDLLSQFPSIGPVPAPCIKIKINLEGTYQDEDVRIKTQFGWPDNKLFIQRLSIIE